MHDYDGFGPESLCRWLKDNPKVDPQLKRFDERLVSSTEMQRAWREFEKVKLGTLHLSQLVYNAAMNAQQEIRRQPVSNDAKNLANVEHLIKRLRRAVVESPLPKDWGKLIELKAGDVPPVSLLFGWHHLNADSAYPLHKFSLVEALDLSLALLDEHRSNEPARALVRKSKNPEVNAFIVNFGWLIRDQFGTYLPGSIARVANAIYSLPKPLGKPEVKDILKRSPEPYLRFSKGGVKAQKKPP